MKIKIGTLLGFALGLVVGAGGAGLINRPSASAAASSASLRRVTTTPKAGRAAATGVAGSAPAQTGSNNGGSGNNAPRAPRPPPDRQARAALALIGYDPEAEQYWLAAINNPDLPANERKNLIEDLADAGLSSTRNPTPDDIQVMAYRLQLIEQLAQNPMDATNAKALTEAQKDLIKSADRALAQAQQP
jgi:hypothetical protein